MTYSELLLKPEWKAKRLAIIERDKYQCQNCGNNKIILRSIKGKISSLKKLQYWINYNSHGPIHKRYELTVEDDSEGSYNVEFYTYTPLSHDRLKYYNLYYEILRKNDNAQFVINLLKEQEIEGEVILHVRGLHVHHEYYQSNYFPWEYPDDALTTLCWICHTELHANQKIKCLDGDRVVIGEYTCCYRCGGSGYFPEYSHIEDGICFRCRGAKYEELISAT